MQMIGGHCVKKQPAILLTLLLVISIMIGGCGDMQTKETAKQSKYPDKPINMIVAFSVGGGADLVARELEKTATKHLGQPLVVINKPGGAGTIGWNELAAATPDGYTLGIVSKDMLLQPLYGETKYHYPTALEPIVQISSQNFLLAVQADKPWKTLDDLIKYAKDHPGQLKYSHGGIGSSNHIIGEMLNNAAKIKIQQVPFRGGGEIVSALLGGHVHIAIIGPAQLKEHVKSGALRVLASSGTKRFTDPIFSDVPTFVEQNIDVTYDVWHGVGVPKGLPIDVKNRLVIGLKDMITSPDFKNSQEKLGLQVDFLDSQAAAAKWLAEEQKLGKVVQETGIVDSIKSQKK